MRHLCRKRHSTEQACRWRLAVGFCILLAIPAAAGATPMVIGISGGTVSTIAGGPADVGWEFRVNRALIVRALGVLGSDAALAAAGKP
jgi:hypothetical protein